MPKFLEEKLKKEYPGDNHAVFGTMNKIGAMRGNRETAKGKTMEKKHETAKKMQKPYSIGEDMHKTFKKFGKAVGKIKPHDKDKLPF